AAIRRYERERRPVRREEERLRLFRSRQRSRLETVQAANVDAPSAAHVSDIGDSASVGSERHTGGCPAVQLDAGRKVELESSDGRPAARTPWRGRSNTQQRRRGGNGSRRQRPDRASPGGRRPWCWRNRFIVSSRIFEVDSRIGDVVQTASRVLL